MSRHQLTRAEGKNVVVINTNSDRETGYSTGDGDGWNISSFLGSAGSSIERASNSLPSYQQPQAQRNVPTTRAAQEANAMFVPVVKYAALGAGLWWGLPMVSAALASIGPLAAIVLAVWFFFIRKPAGQ